MKTTTTLQITLDPLDVRKACEIYMLNHGIPNVNGLNIEFAKSGKDVTASLLVEVDDSLEQPREEISSDAEESIKPIQEEQTTAAPSETEEPKDEAETPVTKSSPLFSS